MFHIKAPAKINLNLRIKGKRTDGFHELETVMLPVDLADELTFESADQFLFTSDQEDIPLDESNLVVKAVRVFERNSGLKVNQKIHLVKKIPHGAGLGGGSSDAASTLLALNDIYGTGFDNDRLRIMAAEIGSDIPFFIYGKTCLCKGRGEIVEPLDWSLNQPVLLIKPPFGIPTPQAYRAWSSSREMEGILYDIQSFKDHPVFNDLERPVYQKYLFLSVLKMWLLQQEETRVALLSGSGSTMFVFCNSEKKCFDLSVRLNFLDKSLWIWSGVTH